MPSLDRVSNVEYLSKYVVRIHKALRPSTTLDMIFCRESLAPLLRATQDNAAASKTAVPRGIRQIEAISTSRRVRGIHPISSEARASIRRLRSGVGAFTTKSVRNRAEEKETVIDAVSPMASTSVAFNVTRSVLSGNTSDTISATDPKLSRRSPHLTSTENGFCTWRASSPFAISLNARRHLDSISSSRCTVTWADGNLPVFEYRYTVIPLALGDLF